MKQLIHHILFPLMSLISFSALPAQSLDRMAVGSSGDIGNTGGQFYSIFIGEAVSGSDFSTLPVLTMGIQQPITPVLLEAHFGPVQATWKEQGAAISWDFASHPHSLQFQVLRSMDGTNFQPIGNILPQDFSSEYLYIDPTAHSLETELLCYQIRWISLGGQQLQSEVVSLNSSNQTWEVRLFPVPFGDELYVEQNRVDTPSNLKLYDAMGRMVLSENFEQQAVISTGHLARGSYKGVVQGSKGMKVYTLIKN